jgi:5-hydroxyisourate hydrolase
MGHLTTHVLDTTAGKPAAGLKVELYRVGSGEKPIASGQTNADGRLDEPLLEGTAFTPGIYELQFHVGDYLRKSARLADPLFLDVVPVRFGVGTADEHHHVPLLLSPHGYTTYRGS